MGEVGGVVMNESVGEWGSVVPGSQERGNQVVSSGLYQLCVVLLKGRQNLDLPSPLSLPPSFPPSSLSLLLTISLLFPPTSSLSLSPQDVPVAFTRQHLKGSTGWLTLITPSQSEHRVKWAVHYDHHGQVGLAGSYTHYVAPLPFSRLLPPP